METLTIGRLARAAGVGIETVRFYQRRGLIARPPRPRAGYRAYSRATLDRLRFIREAQNLGFSLREIEELLALWTAADADCGDVRARAAAKLDDVEAKIAQLERVRAALRTLIGACPGCGRLDDCAIIHAIVGARD
jgi:MerR family mercuric resistance operon transcriptional regulator